MPARCDCGRDVPHALQQLGCLECGAPCCRACAVSVESAPYCRRCAAVLLDTSAPRGAGAFILH